MLNEKLQEDIEVEVKNWLGGLADNASKASLAKEIIALANSGGGSIFIGFGDQAANPPKIAPAAG